MSKLTISDVIEANESAAPAELSTELLALAFGGSGGGGGGAGAGAGGSGLNVIPVNVNVDANINLTLDATKPAEIHAQTVQDLSHAVTEGVRSSETVDALDHLGAEIVDTITHGVDAVGDFFEAVGDFFSGDSSSY